MSYPNQIMARKKIEALTGIKSSLDQIRSVIALVYLLYVANGRNSYVEYCIDDGNNKVKIEPSLLTSIEHIIEKDNLGSIINGNPLITNQYEPLYVGVTLLMKLGFLKMKGRSSTAERTGGNRYPKQLYFANNTLILDLIISGFSDDTRKESLYEWLQNSRATNRLFEERLSAFLSTCTVFTQFKLRDDNSKEVFFQTEGIYEALLSDGSVSIVDSHEYVGPTRIYNNILKEGLEPWIQTDRGYLTPKVKDNPSLESMKDIISTTLDIFNVKDDSVVLNDELCGTPEEPIVSTGSSLQKIFYGTPGSGKSFKVKNDVLQGVDEEYIFRTTFHPDSDYASFVGCYKPRMSKMPSDASKQLLETDELVQKLKDYLQGYGNTSEGETTTRYKNVTKACALFGFDYHDSLVDKDIKNIVGKAYDKEENSYDTTVRAGMECYEKGLVLDKKTGRIEYAFSPQAFTDAYIKAWQEPDKDVYLVIEEINRGNCAQIFGDLFQLLDRKKGVSEYPINADSDLRRYLEDVLGAGNEGIAKGKLKLPANLNIIATMNTSDQSLFPMDSAFKRRWTWECVPIDYDHQESSKFVIKIGRKEYKWNDFLKEANKRIFDTTDSEDKQMGNFFINADVNERQFIDKVMFYLWNDICKEEYHTSKNFFRRKNDDSADGNFEFSFNSLFEPGNSTEYLMQFMEYLGVKPVAESVDSGQSVPSSPADNL